MAQVSGNAAYKSKGNSSYNTSKSINGDYRQMVAQGDTAILIEAAVLSNELADSFVIMFGISQESTTVSAATIEINKRLAGFVAELKLLGITEKAFYVDLITQNRVYDYELQANNTVAKEKLVGFEIKKNISIHFQNREMIDKITVAASKFEIFDLIKVDYIKTDTEKIRKKLLDEAVKIIENKQADYTKIANIKLAPTSRIIEETFAVHQPADMYEAYNAFESGAVNDYYYDNSRIKKVSLRKMTTFYFAPADHGLFDKVINPVIIEPVIQYSLRLKVRFFIVK
jgi:uncharacterized protein YggE